MGGRRVQWLTVLPVAPETVELNSRVRTTILRMKMACELVYDSFKKKNLACCASCSSLERRSLCFLEISLCK